MSLRAAVLAIGLLLLPSMARAVTVTDIIALSKAGVSDTILMALIDADRTVFTLDVDQIVQLRNAGVSEAVVLKMIRSRSEFEPAPKPGVPEMQGPVVVIIGENPLDLSPPVMPFLLPYYVPAPIFGGLPPRRLHRTPAPALPVIGLPIRNGEFVCVSDRLSAGCPLP